MHPFWESGLSSASQRVGQGARADTRLAIEPIFNVESWKSSRFCETFTVPVTVTLHKIRLKKISNERNLDVNKFKLFFAV